MPSCYICSQPGTNLVCCPCQNVFYHSRCLRSVSPSVVFFSHEGCTFAYNRVTRKWVPASEMPVTLTINITRLCKLGNGVVEIGIDPQETFITISNVLPTMVVHVYEGSIVRYTGTIWQQGDNNGIHYMPSTDVSGGIYYPGRYCITYNRRTGRINVDAPGLVLFIDSTVQVRDRRPKFDDIGRRMLQHFY